MNQYKSPAWQGAVQVAGIRLKTIDEALAKLEAVVPDAGGAAPQTPHWTPDGGQPYPPASSPMRTEVAEIGSQQSYDPEPAPIPDSSRRALETFITGVA